MVLDDSYYLELLTGERHLFQCCSSRCVYVLAAYLPACPGLQSDWPSLHQQHLDDLSRLRRGIAPAPGEPDGRPLVSDRDLRKIMMPDAPPRRRGRWSSAGAVSHEEEAAENVQDEYVLNEAAVNDDLANAAVIIENGM